MSDIEGINNERLVEVFKVICSVDWHNEKGNPSIDYSKIKVGDKVTFPVFYPDGIITKTVEAINTENSELLAGSHFVPLHSIIDHSPSSLTEPENAERVASVLSEFEFFNMDERHYCSQCEKFVPLLTDALIIKGVTFCSEQCWMESPANATTSTNTSYRRIGCL